MIDFKRLLDLNFWFAGFLALTFVLWIIIRIKKQNPLLVKLLKKISKMLSTMAFLGFVFLFFSYEQIYFFGSRFWFLFWFAGLIVWAIFIALYAIRKMPKEKDDMEKKKKFLKYLSH
jgi:uncharacterized membrane protein